MTDNATNTLHEQIVLTMRRIKNEELRNAPRIAPSLLAGRAFEHFNAHAEDYEPHLKYATLEHLKQIARDVLAHDHDPALVDAELVDREMQGEMFELELQDRYPMQRKKGDEPQYVLRALMSDDDVFYNVQRMRRVGARNLRHADALEAWHASRGDRAAS